MIILMIKMTKENISQEFRLKNMHEARKYFTGEINENELISKKYKKVCKNLSYIGHLLILIYAAAECV